MKLTENAIKVIKQIFIDNELSLENTYVRVGIEGQGCSGPRYSFALDESRVKVSGDEIVEQDGIKIIQRKEFNGLLTWVEIDYKETEDKKGFVFNDLNPLKVQNGGCGCCGGGCE